MIEIAVRFRIPELIFISIKKNTSRPSKLNGPSVFLGFMTITFGWVLCEKLLLGFVISNIA